MIPAFNNPATQINEAIKSSQLWVRNNTNPRRILLLAVIDRAGRVTSEAIPDTPHPLFLSNQIAQDMLETCQDLRRFVQSGALTIISHADAIEYYNKKPSAVEAVARAYEKVQNRAAPVSRDALTAADPNARQVDASAPTETPVDGGIGTRYDNAGVNMMVRGIVLNVANNTLKVKEAIADLDNLVLSETDLTYIVKETTGSLRKWAKDQLAETRQSDDA